MITLTLSREQIHDLIEALKIAEAWMQTNPRFKALIELIKKTL